MGKHGGFYTPKRTAEYEKAVADCWAEAHQTPQEGPCCVSMEFSKEGTLVGVEPLQGLLSPVLRGDLDNYVKAISDALNGVAYIDDKQIWQLHARKGAAHDQ
jgi:Holliday junction resolvase RusA-like endonuclease